MPKCENYCLKGKSIGFKKFTKKGKYSIPCIIKGIKGGNEYIINFPFDYKNLKKNIDYIIDYHLIV